MKERYNIFILNQFQFSIFQSACCRGALLGIWCDEKACTMWGAPGENLKLCSIAPVHIEGIQHGLNHMYPWFPQNCVL